MMNRQLRRAQKKQDEKTDKEKRRRRAARRSRVENLRAQRAKRRADATKRREQGKDDGKSDGKSDGGGGRQRGGGQRRVRNPGRFSGVLLIATIFFISLNAAVPRPEVEAGGGFLSSPEAFSIIGALYYALFGYFAVLWLNRRQLGRPVALALFAGVMLALGGEAAKLIQGEYAPDLLFLLLIPPALLIGTFGARWVHENSA